MTANTLFGFWVYLMTDFILFATLFATYGVLHTKTPLNLHYALGETVVLLFSSFFCAIAMKQMEPRKTIRWFSLSFLLGAVFLAMICSECCDLVHMGDSWQKNGDLSSYFTLVGTHGLHIFFGLIFMAFFNFQVWRKGLTPVTIRRLDCLSMFWFFSYVVWIFMFTLVYLIGAA